MATGLQAGQGSANRRRTIRLIEGAIATNNAPSGASAGVATSVVDANLGGMFEARSAVAEVYSTAGSGTMTVTVRMWGYDSQAARWFPVGYLNAGGAIAELSADSIRHAEKIDDLWDWDRWYAEIVAIGGTDTAVNVDIRFPVLSGGA